jgi:hypothetical protein
MPESTRLRLASEDPHELIVLMLSGADGSIEFREPDDPESENEPRAIPDSELDPRDRAKRRGFQIALAAVSAPDDASVTAEYRRLAVGDSHELVELLLSAVIAQIAPDDQDTLRGVEVALQAVLSSNERPAAEVLAERFVAANQRQRGQRLTRWRARRRHRKDPK